MNLDIRKPFMINENLQEKLNDLQKISGNSEGSLIRWAIATLHKEYFKEKKGN